MAPETVSLLFGLPYALYPDSSEIILLGKGKVADEIEICLGRERRSKGLQVFYMDNEKNVPF